MVDKMKHRLFPQKRENMDFHSGSEVKNRPARAGDAGDEGSIPESGRSPGEGNGSHSNILVWKIPWIEEPSRL